MFSSVKQDHGTQSSEVYSGIIKSMSGDRNKGNTGSCELHFGSSRHGEGRILCRVSEALWPVLSEDTDISRAVSPLQTRAAVYTCLGLNCFPQFLYVIVYNHLHCHGRIFKKE